MYGYSGQIKSGRDDLIVSSTYYNPARPDKKLKAELLQEAERDRKRAEHIRENADKQARALELRAKRLAQLASDAENVFFRGVGYATDLTRHLRRTKHA